MRLKCWIALSLCGLVAAGGNAQTPINNYYNSPPWLTQPGNTIQAPTIPSVSIPSITLSAPSIQAPVSPSISVAPTSYTPQVYSPYNPRGIQFSSQPITSAPPSSISYQSGSPYNNFYPGPSPYAPTGNLPPISSLAAPPLSAGPQPSILNQLYPEPARPFVPPSPGYPGGQPMSQGFPGGQPMPQGGLMFRPFQPIVPPVLLTPGLATVRNGAWVVTDFLYRLPFNIGLKVEVIKPQDNRYIPISDTLILKRLTEVLGNFGINTNVMPIPCEPPSPYLNVIVTTYSYEKLCVGCILVQLFEVAQPQRIDIDLNGVWQVITWERHEMIASSCDDFAQEIGESLDMIVSDFGRRFAYYHPPDERPCFPEAPEGEF